MLISKHIYFSERNARHTWLSESLFLDRRDKPGDRNLYLSPLTVQCSVSSAKKVGVGGRECLMLCIISYKHHKEI